MSSTLYPIEDIQAFGSYGDAVVINQLLTPVADHTSFGEVLAAETRVLLLNSPDWPTEDYTTEGSILGADLRISAVYTTYEMETEDYASSGSLLGVAVTTFPDLTISYSNWPDEGFSSSGSFISGVVT